MGGAFIPGISTSNAFAKPPHPPKPHSGNPLSLVVSDSSPIIDDVVTLKTTSPNNPPGTNTWVPTPPGSFNPTGTIAMTTVDAGLGGDTPGYALFNSSSQKVVQNDNGIFVVYNNYSNVNAPTGYVGFWRLRRSVTVDGGGHYNGAVWSTMFDSQAQGMPANTWAPAVETDAANNIYVFASHYPPSNTNRVWRMYKFSPPSYNLVSGYPKLLNQEASGKFSVTYDQGRGWFWIFNWAIGFNSPSLCAFDTNGNRVYSKLFFDRQETALHAPATYPWIDVAHDGTIIATWTTETSGKIDHSGILTHKFPQGYYDIHMVYSQDNGVTWIGASGNPVVEFPAMDGGTAITQDDAGTASNSGFQIVDITNQAEFLDWNDPTMVYDGNWNWNQIYSAVYNNGKIHNYYSSGGASRPTFHTPYARFNLATKSIDKRLSPFMLGKISESDPTTMQLVGNEVTILRESTQTGRLYMYGEGRGTDAGKVLVLRSDDNGDNWYRYVLGPFVGSFENTSATRWIQSDGSILGVTYVTADKSIRFFRIT